MILAQRFTHRDDGGSPRRPPHGRSRGLFRDGVRTRGLHRDDGGSLSRRDGDRIHGLRHGDAHSRDLLRDDGHGGRTSCVERVSFQLTPFFPTRQKFVFETSRSFLWKHEKDGTINPALSQSLIPYGMKRPVGENGLYHTRAKDTVTSNDVILPPPLRIKPSSEMIVFCFAFAG